VLKKLPLKQVQSAEVSQKRQAMRKERPGMEILGVSGFLGFGSMGWYGESQPAWAKECAKSTKEQ